MNYESYKTLAEKLNNSDYNFCEDELNCVEQLIEDELLNEDYSIPQNEDEEQFFFSADFLADYFDDGPSLAELNAQYRENQTRFSFDAFKAERAEEAKAELKLDTLILYGKCSYEDRMSIRFVDQDVLSAITRAEWDAAIDAIIADRGGKNVDGRYVPLSEEDVEHFKLMKRIDAYMTENDGRFVLNNACGERGQHFGLNEKQRIITALNRAVKEGVLRKAGASVWLRVEAPSEARQRTNSTPATVYTSQRAEAHAEALVRVQELKNESLDKQIAADKEKLDKQLAAEKEKFDTLVQLLRDGLLSSADFAIAVSALKSNNSDSDDKIAQEAIEDDVEQTDEDILEMSIEDKVVVKLMESFGNDEFTVKEARTKVQLICSCSELTSILASSKLVNKRCVRIGRGRPSWVYSVKK